MKSLSLYILLAGIHICDGSRPHSFLLPNEMDRKHRIDESKIVQAASDKVWETSTSVINSVEKAEKAIVNAAVDAVRDEVDMLFHDHDHLHNPKNRSLKKEISAISTVSNKYPYGWGL
eukprot:202270_1